MSMLPSLASRFFGEQFTLPRPDSSLICDEFSFKGFDYIRTPTKWLYKPVHKRLWKKITKQKFEFEYSAFKTALNRSQAKGLLKYIQLEFDL